MRNTTLILASAALAFLSVANAEVSSYNVIKRNQEPSQPSCVSFTPFAYAGCFSDLSSPRTLLFSGPSTSNMTVETCVAFCKGNGYKYAGLEYFKECFCGASVNGPQVNESQCSFPCTGDKTETCGGNDLLNVYQDVTFPVVDKTTISDYMAMGCYSEGSMGRALNWRQYQLNATAMTVESCLSACKVGGYSFGGLEFGKECYCGVVLGNGTLPIDSTKCNTPCTGAASESCGGSSALNLYVAKDLESTQPCNGGEGGGDSSSSSSSVAPTTTLPPLSSSSSSSSSSSLSFSSPSSSSSSSSSQSSSSSLYPTTSSTLVPYTSPTSSSQSSSSSSYPSNPSTSVPSSSTHYSPTVSLPTTSDVPPYTPPPPPPTSSKPSSYTPPPTECPPPPPPPTSSKPQPSLCTTTIVSTAVPTCEYKLGNWCSTPLPPFTSYPSCMASYSTCLSQLSSCFLQAGFPASLNCLQFSNWCTSISSYCSSSCPGPNCSLSSCKSKYPPPSPPAVIKTVTSIYTCSSTIAVSSTKPSIPSPTSTDCVPIPTYSNICKQASCPNGDYSPGNPVGGIPMPCLTCNNLASSYNAGYPFKLYTDPDTSSCPSYHRSGIEQACRDACDKQYEGCMDTYAEGCRQKKKRGMDSYTEASQKCENQRDDCYDVNDGVTVGSGRCGSWNQGWY